MKQLQLVAILVVLGFMAFSSVGVVWADPPPDNTNMDTLENVVCEGDRTFDVIVNPGNGSPALDPDSTTVGVAKSVYYEPGGSNILVLERGIQGNPPTVWCEWDAPEGHFGGDILLTPAGK
jgi:hypothetical protein